MALNSIDDKMLGEKAHYYCSSSEDEDDSNFGSDGESGDIKQTRIPAPAPTFLPDDNDGKTVQTGPKGVIEDWRQYKQLATEKREKENLERKQLCEKLSFTTTSYRDDEEAKKDECSDDEEFMEMYKQKRIREMQQKFAAKWASIVFGNVQELDRGSFVDAIEKENKSVTVIIHIYDENILACQATNGCMRVLATKYKSVKFCRIRAAEAQVSSNFVENALPTIIVYKDNMVIGNYVRVGDTLGDDFYAPELESFLLEYGMLPSY